VRHVHFAERDTHLNGYAFFYLHPETTPKIVDDLLAKFDGMQVDAEHTLLLLKGRITEKLFVGLKTNFQLSKKQHEDKIAEVFFLSFILFSPCVSLPRFNLLNFLCSSYFNPLESLIALSCQGPRGWDFLSGFPL